MKDLAREGFEWIGSDPGRLYVRGIEPRLCEGDEILRRTDNSVWGNRMAGG